MPLTQSQTHSPSLPGWGSPLLFGVLACMDLCLAGLNVENPLALPIL